MLVAVGTNVPQAEATAASVPSTLPTAEGAVPAPAPAPSSSGTADPAAVSPGGSGPPVMPAPPAMTMSPMTGLPPTPSTVVPPVEPPNPPTSGTGEAPKATFSFERSDSDHQAITFDASGSSDTDGVIVSFSWSFGDGAVADGPRLTQRSMQPGCQRVTLTVTDDQGNTGETTKVVAISAGPPTNTGSADLGQVPTDMALVPRAPGAAVAEFTVSGTNVTGAWPEVEVTVQGAEQAADRFVGQICEGAFNVTATLPVILRNHRLEIALIAGTQRKLIHQSSSVVAGDVLVIQGQSNALSGLWSRAGVVEEHTQFVRSFGDHARMPLPIEADPRWHLAFGERGYGVAAVGRWPLRMGSNLAGEHGVPMAIINHARGGQPIDYFQRNDENPTDTDTNYGQLLYRLDRAGLRQHVRSILYIQGENDGANAAEHRSGFIALHEDWREEFPALERVYVGQVREGCANPSLELRDFQRQFAQLLPITSIMATNGLNGHDGCHFPYEEGYRELGDWFSRLLSRDLYGAPREPDTEAVDVVSAHLSGNTIRLETAGDASALRVDPGAVEHFSLGNTAKQVASIRADGTALILTLAGNGSDPQELRYDPRRETTSWVTNARGIGMLSFILPVQ